MAAILAFVLFAGVSNCAGGHARNGAELDAGDATPTSLYDWSNLSTEGGRYAFVVDGQTVSRLGIDVSDAQGAIDWDAVSSDGIEFAIVRVGYRGTTEGVIYADPNFDANIDGAIDAGLDVGAYFYSQALDEDEAREEAQRCLYEINGRELQYPVAFDFELTATRDGRADGIDAAQAAANARAFCEEIEKGGYSAMVYGNPNDLARYNLDSISGYRLWYAEYGSLPTATCTYTLWQYTNEGSVAGIDTPVDLDLDLAQAPQA